MENHLAFAIFDKYPVSPGHILLVARRHVENFFALSKAEQEALASLMTEGKKFLDDRFKPDGYNCGVNCGKAAGQTIPHVHVHLIPRYFNDMPDPSGGVRGVIPGKRKYPAIRDYSHK